MHYRVNGVVDVHHFIVIERAQQVENAIHRSDW
jgi:hypothetical protein